ncbi:MAG: Flp pilus assembly complex ATPase component TadA [Gammaproteobacteria bacterium]|nr:Flp pilus assembly complex ATPase component TadA [Gammaproteobacteria bacterium]
MNSNIIQYVDDMINNAVLKKASDIHVEIYETYCRIRFRIDGILHEIEKPQRDLFEQIISRIKILSQLNIAEKRLPQDGHFLFPMAQNKPLNIRVSVCPTAFGEKAVLRLLDDELKIRGIDSLGFDEIQKKHFLNAITKPQGLILVTGPTGSGKTVTLYSALNYLNSGEKNISTVEDPVEICLAGMNQIPAHSKIGLNFSHTLRALLRQDPDIIMIGEIRDLETAEIAIKAAQTGHLVLSTLHTNSALEAITRLKNMGIAPYHMTASLRLMTAQRLLRKLCEKCKKAYRPSKIEQQQFHITSDMPIYKPNGCCECHKGYLGRMAIHEIYPVDESAHPCILDKNPAKLKDFFNEKNIKTLYENAIQKVYEGKTSLEEIKRVMDG